MQRARVTPGPGNLAVATIEPAKPAPPATTSLPPATTTAATSDDTADTGGIKVIRPPGSAAPGPTILRVPQEMHVALQPAPDSRLVEKSRFGLLPRRGPDGARPADVYARPVVIDQSLRADAPRIALMIGGMGLNARLTTSAAASLPPAVTLGFAPYGDDLDRQVAAVRDAGHEVILQVPMEGFGDPASTTMSHLLMTGLEGPELLDRLHWHMGRFVGYVGVASFLGGKFTADNAVLPVLRDVGSRGLLFFDDGTTPRTRVPSLAPQSGVPMVRADVVLDASGDPAAVDAALAALESRARERGQAIGFASGLPAALDRITRFAQGLAGRGIALVPISAVPATSGAAAVQP